LGQLREIHGQLIEAGYQVLFISPDRPDKVRSVSKGKDYGYTLLSDSSADAARAFGIAFEVDTATLTKYEKYGIDLEEASGREHHLLPVPAVFITNAKGEIRFQYVDPDYRARIDPQLLLAAARAVRE